jgi:hypothetical protein
MSIFELRRFASRGVWERSVKIMGRVTYFRPGIFKLTGMVLSSEQSYFYNPWIAKDGTFFCDCQGHENSNTICSHIMALLRKADFEGYDIDPYLRGLDGMYEEDKAMEYKTSLEGYNRLFGGLQSGRHISCLFAPPEVGKSYTNAQFCVDMANLHKLNSLVIDTEGGFAPEWIDLIAKRFGIKVNVKFVDWRVRVKADDSGKREDVTPEYDYKDFNKWVTANPMDEDAPTVYIYDARHLVQIFPFFGRPIDFKIKGGVIEPIEGGDMKPIWESPIGIMVEKFNIGYVANDSLSAPIESFFTGGQTNYRTRTKATQVWLGRAQDLIDEYKVVFMNTVHATVDHTNQWADPSPVGGKAVLHNNKYIAYIEKYQGKAVAKKLKLDWRTLRRMKIYRHMTKAAFSDMCYLMTTDAGVVDFNPKDAGLDEKDLEEDET